MDKRLNGVWMIMGGYFDIVISYGKYNQASNI